MTKKTNTFEKQISSLATRRKLCGVLSFVFALLAIVLLIGMVVTVLLIELKRSADSSLFAILAGSFAGASVVFACLGFLTGKAAERLFTAELDKRELLDSEESFFVGDGTLATFGEDLCLHAERGEEKKKDIHIPYSAIRFFSVCTRRAPREKGEWSVVLEIPARYLAKEGKAEKNAPPALVQTDAKQRLYDCLSRHGLTLLGELPSDNGQKKSGNGAKKPFKPVIKFHMPHAQKRKRALITAIVGGVVFGAGIAVAFTLSLAVGAVLAVLGLFVGGRAILSFRNAQARLLLYREGLFWKDISRENNTFLKWEEVERVEKSEQEGHPILDVHCAYGAYHFLCPTGAYEAIETLRRKGESA